MANLANRKEQPLSRTKRKLLIVLGAGSSLDCGMPSTVDIDQLMLAWSAAWSDPPPFPPGSAGRGVFGDLWAMVSAYHQENPQPHMGLRLNYEKVLGEMVALASWATPSPFGNALRNAVQDPALSSDFTWPKDQEGRYFYRNLIIQQLGDLIRQLAAHMRERCMRLDVSSPSFGGYASILRGLADEFDVGIYNLNYDTLAISALPDAFTGFSGEAFDPMAVADRQDWNFVYHLHGSVHHSLAGSPHRQTMVWKDDLTGPFVDSHPYSPGMAAEFRPIIPTSLVAGGFKLDQILAEPAQTLYAAMVRHVQQADCFLIAGYGFGDVHVNRALENRFATTTRDWRRGRPPTVVITKTDPSGGLIGDREGYELFARELRQTLSTHFTTSGATPGPRCSLPELLERGIFETDSFGRTRVWHAGFSAIGERLDQLARTLRGP